MKRMSILFLVAILSIGYISSYAQTFTPPKDYKFEVPEDYVAAEPTILECINYLQSTSPIYNENERTSASQYLLDWVTGTQTMRIEIDNILTQISKKNSELMIPYISGWIKLAIESPVSKDDYIKCRLYGLKAALNYYSTYIDQGIKKDKSIEKLIELNKKNGLEKWIREQL